LGTWQSNIDITIAELRKAQPLTYEEEQFWRQKLTPKKVTFTADRITIEKDGEVDKQTYRIVSKDDDNVVLEFWFSARNQVNKVRVHFLDDDTFRLDIEEFTSECYRRVP